MKLNKKDNNNYKMQLTQFLEVSLAYANIMLLNVLF